jgi:hypothetical protein
LFGGGLKGGEKPEEGFFREMREELAGIDVRSLILEHKIYNWKKDLERIDGEINDMLQGNFNLMRGFAYNEQVPQEALGKNRGLEISYKDLICNVTEDHYFIGSANFDLLKKVRALEGRNALLLSESFCKMAVFYPTDKLALMHDMARNYDK